MSRGDRVAKGVTRVVEKRNITTGKQMNLRLTSLDEDALSLLVEKIQTIMPRKNISRSRVLRAVGYLNEDFDWVDKLIQSIIRNT
ncbi:hypothetical protein SK355_12165 (plasmid) [Candidatus Fukatsuia symbiotica]|uniref:Uncharacterized protein n=1 Tax=Candidatus Fukatsuia symbiotica TaxID=1878942 RepID=A0A2U8I8U1_9GAMM|nr:hypothetical protein [Candidatus Fukatsuia symbiotica]AWK15537.1 hypothetical protein CCS41_14010 [Candidatus Fukatsuia symbiotica]MEA9445928.1 hypothetical protein [Candidatus Fukatsuia symbiotica]